MRVLTHAPELSQPFGFIISSGLLGGGLAGQLAQSQLTPSATH